MEKPSPVLKESLLKAIRTQIKTNNPPQTKQTLQRLLNEGFANKDAYLQLATALMTELYFMMKEKRPFSEQNYVQLLAQLPDTD